ncbi:putative branched-chain amino acid transport ATP-binding protein LivG [Candidatus Bilamarchaeum dharawalense]|uniref:Putative branched-chain amino acid transport ATP-binding protein LivG n=1 Tax=Candidatus Bilamarchaeum dharawalense TaxID=2885759 RepID=A0A5E4LM73_9ARCH|nr:putative branched-chain amino acid transport ATP-binding protein LivG [Candidatus Bilamarchaeum dharawalense]
MTLTVNNLHVTLSGKEILKGISFTLEKGKIYAFMGPNGSGKSTLCNALMGDPNLTLKGSIKLNGEELIRHGPDKRSKAGIFLAFQNPEEIEGVKVSGLIRKVNSSKAKKQDLDKMVREHEELVKTSIKLGLDKSYVSRDLNVGFSGGEKKRLEILQMLALNPRVVILDEIDSGLDVDGIKLITKAIKKMNNGTRTFLIVTHYPRILKYLKPDVVHILMGGKIVQTGASKLAHDIEKKGYSGLKDHYVQ